MVHCLVAVAHFGDPSPRDLAPSRVKPCAYLDRSDRAHACIFASCSRLKVLGMCQPTRASYFNSGGRGAPGGRGTWGGGGAVAGAGEAISRANISASLADTSLAPRSRSRPLSAASWDALGGSFRRTPFVAASGNISGKSCQLFFIFYFPNSWMAACIASRADGIFPPPARSPARPDFGLAGGVFSCLARMSFPSASRAFAAALSALRTRSVSAWISVAMVSARAVSVAARFMACRSNRVGRSRRARWYARISSATRISWAVLAVGLLPVGSGSS
jgi:hypothetical protein